MTKLRGTAGRGFATAEEGGDQVSVHVDMTQTGNVGSGEDTLATHTLAAGTLGTDDDLLEIFAWGTLTADAITRRVRLHFGGTIISDVTTSFTDKWTIRGTVVRTGATTQKALGVYNETFSGPIVIDTTSPAETLSGTVVIKVTGENQTDSTNDVVVIEGFIIKKVRAPA